MTYWQQWSGFSGHSDIYHKKCKKRFLNGEIDHNGVKIKNGNTS